MEPEQPFDAKAYWEKRLGNAYDLGAVGEIGLGKRYNEWMYRVRRAAFRRHVGPLVRRLRPRSVVDVGSGTGFYIDQWRDLGIASISGVDITEVAVGALQRRYPDFLFVCADISALRPDVPEADAVSAFDVLFHIVDDDRFAAALQNIASMLRPGGVLILSNLFQHGNTFDSRHQVGRTLSSITQALEAAGFTVVLRRPVFWLMADPTDTSSRLLKLSYKVITRAIARGPIVAWLLGACLYPIEVLAQRIKREGPSIELMIARLGP